MNFFLGVDAGGTKIRAVIIDEASQIKAEEVGGPANYHNIGLKKTITNVYRAIAGVLSKAYLSENDITWATIGIAACDSQKDHERLFGGFTTDVMAGFAQKLTVVNDTKVALYSGTLPPALVVICGTGANVYGKNATGTGAMAGNWGYFLGDKGSGYILAQRMFQTIVEHHDGIIEAPFLATKLEKKLGVKSSKDISDWYNDAKPSIHEISDFAPLVIETAEEGDEVAKQLVDKTVQELGKALLAVVKRLKVETDYNRGVIVGGLFESKYFRALFEGHVTALLKKVRIVKPLVSAAVGAAIMAKQEWSKTLSSTEA